MTEEKAKELAAQIEHDYPGLVKATPEVYRNSGRIRLLLVAGQRKTFVYQHREWESLLHAWQGFLPSKEGAS